MSWNFSVTKAVLKAPDYTAGVAYLFRVEAQRYAAMLDEFENPVGPGRTELLVRCYKVIGYTTSGAQIDVYGEKKFVNLRAVKQFACPTLEEAKRAFVHRQRRRRVILTAQLQYVDDILRMVSDEEDQGNIS